MAGWRFVDNALNVAHEPSPARSGGHRKIIFEAPGVDGIAAVIDDGRLPVQVCVTLQARSSAECELLTALFESGTRGELEIPHGDDAWVYADAWAEGRISWEYVVDDKLYRARVEFVCPDPRPTWKSTGEPVF